MVSRGKWKSIKVWEMFGHDFCEATDPFCLKGWLKEVECKCDAVKMEMLKLPSRAGLKAKANGIFMAILDLWTNWKLWEYKVDGAGLVERVLWLFTMTESRINLNANDVLE